MSTNALAVVGGGSIMPALTVQEAATRYNVMVEFTKTVMVKDQDYGTIPGVQKPCLYKAGAEKLSSLFGLTPAFELVERREDWTGKETNGEPLFYYFYKCKLYRGGELVGEADGSCNSWEKKYRYRDSKRKCPKCGGEFIIQGKAEYGGGFLCYAKKGGCGAKFTDKDPTIIGQTLERVINPDIPEVINTVQKMAQKRALVAAVLIACNASAFYTQDAEDMRTIDVVDYETLEAEHDLRITNAKRDNDARQAEIDRQRAEKPPATKPEVIRELSDTLDQPPAIKTIEMRHAKQVAETDAVLADVKKDEAKNKGRSGAHGVVPLDKLANWKKLKDDIRGYTGSDDLYRATIRTKAGVDHANEIQEASQATEIWSILKAELKRLGLEANRKKQDDEVMATLEHASEVIGARAFGDVLFEHSCNTIADALALESDPLQALLARLKQCVDERKGSPTGTP